MKKELKFIYNSEKRSDRKALGYASSLTKHVINEFDIAKENLTSTQILNMASAADCSVMDLLDKDHDKFKTDLKDADYDDANLATMITNDASLLNTPIIITGDKAYVIRSSYDFNKIDMSMDALPESPNT